MVVTNTKYLIVSMNSPEILSPAVDFAFRFVRICGNFETPHIKMAMVFRIGLIFDTSIFKKLHVVALCINL